MSKYKIEAAHQATASGWVVLAVAGGAELAPISVGEVEYEPWRQPDAGPWLVRMPVEHARGFLGGAAGFVWHHDQEARP